MIDSKDLASRVSQLDCPNGRIQLVEFDSLGHLVRFAELRERAHVGNGVTESQLAEATHAQKPTGSARGAVLQYIDSACKQSTHAWDLGVGFTGAIQLAKNGWLDGVKKIKNHSAEITNRTDDKLKAGFVSNVSGNRVNVPRYLTGRPDCMDRFVKTPKPHPIIDLAVGVGVSSAVHSDQVVAYGQALVALVEKLQGKGYSVGLSVVHGVYLDTTRSFAVNAVRLKHPQQSLSLADFAFALIHPAFQRRLLFTINETYVVRFPRRYGAPSALNSTPMIALRKHWVSQNRFLLDYAPKQPEDFAGKTTETHLNCLIESFNRCVDVSA